VISGLSLLLIRCHGAVGWVWEIIPAFQVVGRPSLPEAATLSVRAEGPNRTDRRRTDRVCLRPHDSCQVQVGRWAGEASLLVLAGSWRRVLAYGNGSNSWAQPLAT